MMREEIRKSRVAMYGSFLHCAARNTICSLINNELGICKREECILDDPEYKALQKRIEHNRRRKYENGSW